mgnify:CR=1 FL=1
MNRIDQLFQTHKDHVLSIYFCAGTPTLEGTAEVIRTLERKGVQMIEIGIPFSDPMADGPVIQHAATQALRNGMTLRKLFSQLEQIHTDVRIPLVLMGYLNPIMQYGFENFCRQCQACGIDGVIIPDLPYKDYLESYRPIAQQYGIHVIMLITPETSEERIRQIDAHTDGFIYMVSSAAVTGAQKEFNAQKQAYFQRIKQMQLRIHDDRVRYLQQIHLRISSGIRLRMHHREQIRDLARGGKRCQKGHRQTVGNAKKRRIINHSAILAAYSFSQSIFLLSLCQTKRSIK